MVRIWFVLKIGYYNLKGFCIWGLHLSNLLKSSKEVSNDFTFGVCNLGNLANEWANLAKMSSCVWLCKPDRVSKVMRKKSARLETSYFYPLPSPNANSLGDDLFLSFAFCYGSLQTTTNAKSICQSLWRCCSNWILLPVHGGESSSRNDLGRTYTIKFWQINGNVS